MMGIRLLKGRDVAAEGEILVSEEFVRQAGWTGDPIGRQVSYYDGSKMTVAGVVPDYSIRSAYESQLPIMLIAARGSMHHYLRLKVPFDENLRKLNEVMKEAFPPMMRCSFLCAGGSTGNTPASPVSATPYGWRRCLSC